jgi:gas vesicle protein
MFHSLPFRVGLWGLKKTVMSTGKVILGTVAGLALGAIGSILFAPEKGSVTRKQIREKGNDYVDKLKSKLDELFDSVSEKLESTKNDAENLAENGKAIYNDAKKDVKNAATNFKHDVAADINRATS